MIGIFQNSELSESKISSLLDEHWSRVNDTIKHIRYRKNCDSEIISGSELIAEIDNLIAPMSLSQIVKWDYKTISSKISSKDASFVYANDTFKKLYGYSATAKDSSGKYKKSNDLLFSERIYNKFRTLHGKNFVEDLKITVCPYCNRNYINSGLDITTAQLDHFFPKSKYPLLALSFFNLIPCCYSCNHLKSDGKIHGKKLKSSMLISPFDKSKVTDDIIRFSYLPKAYGKYQIEVQGFGISQKVMEENIAVFQLKERYSVHTDIIDELHIKVESMSPEYLSSVRKLMNKDGDLSYLSEEEIYFGTYLTQDKYYLRPLSKFEHDIINQIRSSVIP